MRTSEIQSVKRLSTLIFADRISGDERGLAFPTAGFRHSALVLGTFHPGRAAFRILEKRIANKAAAPNRRPALRFGRAGFIGSWIRYQSPFPAAVGELIR